MADPDSPDSPESPDSLRAELQRALGDSCRISSELGGGGMARVFVAEESATGRRIVVKVLPPDLSRGVLLERFTREVQVAALLQHPNIIPVLNTGQAGDLVYYTMPLAGDTLRALLDAKRQLPLGDAVRYAAEISAALSYAHRQNIVHRDIKPENILIQDGHALVADFGIARAIERVADSERLTSTGLALGTPRYMSPEQASADRDIDGRADIYSLACVVYEMLAGEPPFVSDSARTLAAKHMHETPPSVRTARPDLPVHIDRALRIALSKSPADRFATADVFAEALRNPALSLSEFAQVSSWRPRTRTVVAAALGVVALAAWALWPKTVTEPARIAVLNFEATDTSLAVFGRALTTDVIDVLRRDPDLAPLSHEAMRAVPAGAPLDSSLRAKLDVATFITGRVERIGDSTQVTVRITDAKTLIEKGTAPIRVQFPRSMVLQLRDTVIAQVGRRLLAEFGPAARLREWRSETGSSRAWELRQRAQDLSDSARKLPRQSSGFAAHRALLARADSLLDGASRADAKWIEPYLARGWIRLQSADLAEEGQDSAALAEAVRFANEALRLRPGNPSALELRGSALFARWQTVRTASIRDSAEADLQRAVTADETLTRSWRALSVLRDTRGDAKGAAVAARHALDSDPYSFELGRTFVRMVVRKLFERQADSARNICSRARALLHDDARVRTCTLTALGWTGRGPADINAAWSELEWTESKGPFALTAEMYVPGRFWVATILARSGLRDSARAVALATNARLQQAGEQVGAAGKFSVNEAQFLTALGEKDRALSLLEATVKADSTQRESIGQLPWFDSLRTNPRFVQLVKPR